MLLNERRFENMNIVTTLALGFATKARACKGAGQKWSLGIHFMLPGV
jgi:hypothetical protein